MSLSDSDLDFESADEGGEDVDIELSDLSDDEKPDETKKDDTLAKSAEEHKKVEVAGDVRSHSEPDESNEPVAERKKDGQDETEKLEPEIKEEERDEPQKPMEQNKNDDEVDDSKVQEQEKFNVEGDDEIDRLLNDMNIKEEEAAKVEQVPAKISKEPIVMKAETQPVSKKVEVVATGWDDTEFSDVEDDKDDRRPVKVEPVVQSKPLEEKKSVASEPSTKTKDIASLFSSLESKPAPSVQPETKQSGWSWTKFGSSVLSSATALLETVEGAIGAPDPAELAAKVVKAQAENEKIQEELASSNPDAKGEQDEKPSSDSFNDWDTNEWFTLPKQLNKLATTVRND